MKFMVFRVPSALNRLAALWNAGPDRAVIATAANTIDQLLKSDPESKGESRGGNVRILIHAPLAVYFKVSPDDCKVTVFAVWRWTPP